MTSGRKIKDKFDASKLPHIQNTFLSVIYVFNMYDVFYS